MPLERSIHSIDLKPYSECWPQDIIASTDSHSEFYQLPTTLEEAIIDLQQVARVVRRGYGNAYAAFHNNLRVGGGQISAGPVVKLGYWVDSRLRRQGYGQSILAALEEQAVNDHPYLERLQLRINQRNLASLALAETADYQLLEQEGMEGDKIFWKIP